MEILTKEAFKEKVYNYDNADKGWSFEGTRPAIVDFYADWCGPCRAVAPVLDQISKEYEGRVDVYKVNTDKEPEIAQAFGVSSIPTILFIPTEGQPQVSRGAMPKNSFVQAISDIFKIN